MRNDLSFNDMEKTFSVAFTEKVEVVDGYPKGYDDGHKDGVNEGYEKGKSEAEANCETEKKQLSSSLSEALTSGAANTESLEDNIDTAKADITAVKTFIESYDKEVPTGTLSNTYPALLDEVIMAEKEESKNEGYDEGINVGHNNGYIAGFREGKTEGIEQGKQAQYDEFWDSYQNYGNRAFARLFNSVGWNDITFKPKYSMKYYDSANAMFAESRITDLQAILDRQGVTFDFSGCYSFANLLQDSTITHIGEVSTVSASAVTNIFYLARNLKTVDLLILKSNGSQTFSNSFQSCNALENIVIEGVIGNNVDFKSCPLTKASITSIVNALSDITSGKTLTLKKSAVNNAFGINVDDETTWVSGSEYYNLRHSKDNWTFSYV